MAETYVILNCSKEQFQVRFKSSELSFPLTFQHEEFYPLEIVVNSELSGEVLKKLEENNIKVKRYTC